MSFSVMPVFGTRPEAIKMAPVVSRLRDMPEFVVTVCLSGQHREMLDHVLGNFGIVAEENLNVMQPGQTINELTVNLMRGLDRAYETHRPDLVLVHGDTTTCFVAALAAFHRRIAVGHVEAGLRTGNLAAPWPEEANRRLTAVVADLHFAPTAGARDNLLRENVAPEKVHVTGNTVVDALLSMRDGLREWAWQPAASSPLSVVRPEARVVLVTGHRRESFGKGLEAICRALRRLATRYPEVDFVYPVHLNPGVQQAVFGMLAEIANVHLIPPLDYRHFVWTMDRCHLILTDSGGIQEEAPSLGKPVLVMRDNTERPEARDCGALRVVGVDEESIFRNTCEVLDDVSVHQTMSRAGNPFGDGHASERIAALVLDWFRAREARSA